MTRRQCPYDEHIMAAIDEIVNDGEKPWGQCIHASHSTTEIGPCHLLDYFNYRGRPFSVLANGGYRDGKSKVQPARR